MSEHRGTARIKVIPISGNAIDWPLWSEKFLARARRKGYKNILLGKEVVPDDATDLNAIVDAEEKNRRKRS